jgi:hypothetical protein
MNYSILIYESEAVAEALSPAEESDRIARHQALQKHLQEQGKLGPVARLMPTTAATTLRPPAAGTAGKPQILDGPFAETKEQLIGFYVVECDSLDEAVELAKMLPLETGSLEVRPVGWYRQGS